MKRFLQLVILLVTNSLFAQEASGVLVFKGDASSNIICMESKPLTLQAVKNKYGLKETNIYDNISNKDLYIDSTGNHCYLAFGKSGYTVNYVKL